MLKRKLEIRPTLARKSLFLLGPRQTGKSTYLRHCFPEALYLDLLHPKTFLDLTTQVGFLESLIKPYIEQASNDLKIIIIDEIQKLPSLLDEVHRLIERDKQLRFILTGSSARKLRAQGVNLLGGRARRLYFHPLSLEEATEQGATSEDTLKRLCLYGGLPHVFLSTDPKSELSDYVGLYLQEEIQNEALTRSIQNFSRFLKVAAASNTEQIIFSNIANDAQIPARTVREYFQILEDTLVGRLLPAFGEGSLRKPMSSPKFYFFDVGVANSLTGRIQSQEETPEFGKIFEHFVYCEIRTALDYLNPSINLLYWRTTSKFEVDFILQTEEGKLIAIEVKSNRTVTPKDLSGLKAFGEDFKNARKIVVCREDYQRKIGDIEIMPIFEFCKMLWNHKIW